MDRLTVHAVTLVVVHLRDGRIDRDLVEVRTAQPRDLRVDVRVNATGQQRIVREVDAGHDVRDAERHLLRFREEVVGIAVQHHPPHRDDRHELLGHDLRGIEHVEAERLRLFFREDLQAQLPLRVGAGLDGLPQVAAMKVGIGAGNLHGLVPDQRMGSRLRAPVELDEVRLAVVVDQAVGMHAEALHRPITARDRAVGHRPHQHVGDLGHQRREVPEGVMRRAGLRHREVRFRLRGVDQIRKLHRVLDEEHRDVVADEIPVAFDPCRT